MGMLNHKQKGVEDKMANYIGMNLAGIKKVEGNSLAAGGNTQSVRPRPWQKGQSLGEYVLDCIYSRQEEGRTGETKEAYEARVYAKAKAGKKLTPEEMSFLARTNPIFYQKVLRTQALKKSLENQLKSCRSKQEAEAVYGAAVSSISTKDPDREMILAGLQETYKEFKKSDHYNRLPERVDEEGIQGGMCLEVNGNGYQELYLLEGEGFSFQAHG